MVSDADVAQSISQFEIWSPKNSLPAPRATCFTPGSGYMEDGADAAGTALNSVPTLNYEDGTGCPSMPEVLSRGLISALLNTSCVHISQCRVTSRTARIKAGTDTLWPTRLLQRGQRVHMKWVGTASDRKLVLCTLCWRERVKAAGTPWEAFIPTQHRNMCMKWSKPTFSCRFFLGAPLFGGLM